MPGSLSNVTGFGGYGTALSVIQSESREETERSTVHNTVVAKSHVPSQKQLQTQESNAGASAVTGGIELNKSIQNGDSRNNNERDKSMRLSFQQLNTPESPVQNSYNENLLVQ